MFFANSTPLYTSTNPDRVITCHPTETLEEKKDQTKFVHPFPASESIRKTKQVYSNNNNKNICKLFLLIILIRSRLYSFSQMYTFRVLSL